MTSPRETGSQPGTQPESQSETQPGTLGTTDAANSPLAVTSGTSPSTAIPVAPARPTTSDQPGRGIGFSILASMLITSNDAVSKLLTDAWPIGQIMATRGSIILLVILIVLTSQRRLSALRIQNKGMMAVRAAAISGATFAFLTAISRMPLADALAIVFVAPIFATLMAVFFLQERVGWRRWAAMGLGFFGVLVGLNPGGMLSGTAISYGWDIAILPIVTAVFVAARDVSSRRLVSGDDSLAIMFYTVFAVVLCGIATSTQHNWVTPEAFDLGLVSTAAIFMFGAYFFQIESLRFAPVNLVVPFRYFSLIFAVIVGMVVWGDVPSWNMILGGGIIVTSGLIIWKRESRRR